MRPCKVLARGYFDSSMTSSTLLTPRQAADKIGISYPALKHWILAGRIRTVKTPGDRNQLLGTIAEVIIDGLLAKVVLAIGDQRVTAIITADAVRELALKPGDSAVALIKATEVMIGRP
jgi:molybdopterin-binding protein